jgi:S-(hydroxymethyl)glutathione dehydrogenase/alcohol dehydrogenase
MAQVAAGSSVVVIGCGAVGLNAVQAAALEGAEVVVAVDLDPKRRALACRFGATQAIDPAEDPVPAVKALTGGRGADYVFESAGNAKAFRLSVEAVRPGGMVVWLGKVNVDQEVAFRWGALMGEKRIVRSSYGGARPRRDFPWLADLYLSGRLKLDELVTERLALEEINQGFERMGRRETVRSVVVFPH